MITILAIFLGLGAVLAAAGYVRSAYDDFGGRDYMPELLIAFVLAVGFLALALK